ncbi:VOC family protein [Ilumatobacter sp.]|uniref:VOC family protein n=1 Tax=Ilumatobacter sp. TaxID=1967498 RepID=UPI003B516749
MSARVEWLTVASEPGAWRSIGLEVGDDGFVPLVGTSLRIVEPPPASSSPGEVDVGAPAGSGIVGWALSGIDLASGQGRIDGLATEVVEPRTPVFAHHAIAASGLDHVVVTTDDLERTSRAVESSTGCELKRIREVGAMRQGFHRIGRGGLIVELVERAEHPEGPARFWGVVLNVDDLDAACARLGDDRISAPKDAVQPGRRIATVRADVGLGLPVALMTP